MADNSILNDVKGLVKFHSNGIPGPDVIVMTVIHGNETAGLKAANRVLDKIVDEEIRISGRIFTLMGNIEAYEAKNRFVKQDMNRIWDSEAELILKDNDLVLPYEYQRKKEIISFLDSHILNQFDTEVDIYALDLHTTSSPSVPFISSGDHKESEELYKALGIPRIINLRKHIPGTFIEYMWKLGARGTIIEGGQNEDEESVKNLEAGLWISLVSAGSIKRQQCPKYEDYQARLKNLTGNIPLKQKITERRVLFNRDNYQFDHNFGNFEQLSQGQTIAHLELKASADSYIFMPLNQGQGDDLCFITEEVK